jgi:hypothetical protein
MKRIIAKSTIAKLNSSARTIARKDGQTMADALVIAAHRAGLTEVKRDDSTILYRNKQRAYVNCWYDNCIETGFDDQIDWAFAA